jgi:5-methylcytosine-specific restriction enzyme subunit McrC
MLADEVEELVHRGLARRYVSLSEKLESPRGKLLIDKIAQQGGITEAKIPCRHFERRVNWHLNQVIRAGLEIAAGMTEDRELRRRTHRLAAMLGDIEHIDQLELADIDLAERALSRLTEANAAALTIIRLLRNMQGVAFGTTEESSRTSGFLFDMNVFFQRLLSRLLRENLTAQRIVDERGIDGVFAYSTGANPKGRSAPKPRPDYALFRANKVSGFLDAKYRDIWENTYALASPSEVSVLFYATMSAEARDEQIEIRQPVIWRNKRPAYVILRPVLLPEVAELVHPKRSRALSMERRQFADELVIFGTRTPAITTRRNT